MRTRILSFCFLAIKQNQLRCLILFASFPLAAMDANAADREAGTVIEVLGKEADGAVDDRAALLMSIESAKDDPH